MYSKEITKEIISFLEEDGWSYEFDEEKGIIKSGLQLHGKIKELMLYVGIFDTYVTTYGVVNISADIENKLLISEFITRANYGLAYGNFEMDFNDGEIRYKTFLDCEGIILTKEMIEKLLAIPAVMFDFYGDALLKVLFGFAKPEDAVRECENKTINNEDINSDKINK